MLFILQFLQPLVDLNLDNVTPVLNKGDTLFSTRCHNYGWRFPLFTSFQFVNHETPRGTLNCNFWDCSHGSTVKFARGWPTFSSPKRVQRFCTIQCQTYNCSSIGRLEEPEWLEWFFISRHKFLVFSWKNASHSSNQNALKGVVWVLIYIKHSRNLITQIESTSLKGI